MFAIFKKLMKPRERDLEQLIFDIAEYKKDEDYQLLYRLLKHREVYVPADPGTMPGAARPGVPGGAGQVGDRSRSFSLTNPSGSGSRCNYKLQANFSRS